MSKLNTGATCHCCGAELTAPQFFNGNVYGWSCILKVNGGAKRKKEKGIWVNADSVEFKQYGDTDRIKITAVINGIRLSVPAYVDPEKYENYNEFSERTMRDNGSEFYKGGLLQIVSNRNKPLFDSLEIIHGDLNEIKDVIHWETKRSLLKG